ncbi:hypothetical protein AC481_05960 [miscellaneous Crenarchaeota group archaeon SMTZ-80]|nr:MAG: hypothetical protein AC481_05960 [miscellaneous Crenarchaeota group archaeon SMTZ-80]
MRESRKEFKPEEMIDHFAYLIRISCFNWKEGRFTTLSIYVNPKAFFSSVLEWRHGSNPQIPFFPYEHKN